MSFGLGSGILGTAVSMGLDNKLSSNKPEFSPIPSFYFSVEIFDNISEDLSNKNKANPNDIGEGGGSVLNQISSMVGLNNTLSFDSVEDWHNKSFIEISGIEITLDPDSKNEGGYNYPIDLPKQLKNPNIVLKRLFRPINANPDKDKWTKWIKDTMHSMAYWDKPIEKKNLQIIIYHPNLSSDSGKPYILHTVTVYDAYPVKQSFGTLNSTAEELFTEEIEISYSNTQALYGS